MRTLQEELDTNYLNRKSTYYKDFDQIMKLLEMGKRPLSIIFDDCEEEREHERIMRQQYPELVTYFADKDDVAEYLSRKSEDVVLPSGIRAVWDFEGLPFCEEVISRFRKVLIIEDPSYLTNVANMINNCFRFGGDALFYIDTVRNPFGPFVSRMTDFGNMILPLVKMAEDRQANRALLKKCGYEIFALALRKQSLDIRDIRKIETERAAIMVGNEANGLKEESIDSADHVITIPMYNHADSLNLTDAAAIALYELGRGEANHE